MDNLLIYLKNLPKITKVVLGVVSAGLIVIIVITGILINRGEVRDVTLAEITNYSETANIPVGYRDEIDKRIGVIINEHLENVGLVFSEAVIREGTYQEKEGEFSTNAKFIVDVPELKYSFQVDVIWSNKTDKNEEKTQDPDITIKCPHYLDVIYTDTKCIVQTPEQQLERYLPYYEDLDSGQRFGVSMKKFGGEPYVAVEVKSCGDTSVAERAVNATKKWMKSIYLDPNDYTIKPLDICKR